MSDITRQRAIRLTDEQWSQVQQAAKQRGVSTNTWVSEAISLSLQRPQVISPAFSKDAQVTLVYGDPAPRLRSFSKDAQVGKAPKGMR